MKLLEDLYTDKTKLHTVILAILYGVGVIGLVVNQAVFVQLTPLIILISAFLMVYQHALTNTYFFINLFFLWVAAFLLEMAGANTGKIFGHYTYGNALGFKIADTPIIMGLNWFIVCYSSIQVAQRVLKRFPMQNLQSAQLALALMAGAFMVLLDIFIEPVAIKLDFWQWHDNLIPLQNFTAWFCFGTVFCFWMIKSGIMQNNIMGFRLYFIQLIFFALINLAQLL